MLLFLCVPKKSNQKENYYTFSLSVKEKYQKETTGGCDSPRPLKRFYNRLNYNKNKKDAVASFFVIRRFNSFFYLNCAKF